MTKWTSSHLVTVDFPADGDVVYAYDGCPYGQGRLCSVADQAGNSSYAYSAKGELIQETKIIQGRVYVTGYQFDKNGNLSTITYPSGRTVNYALDAADRVSSVTTTKGATTTTLASSVSHRGTEGTEGGRCKVSQVIARGNFGDVVSNYALGELEGTL